MEKGNRMTIFVQTEPWKKQTGFRERYLQTFINIFDLVIYRKVNEVKMLKNRSPVKINI